VRATSWGFKSPSDTPHEAAALLARGEPLSFAHGTRCDRYATETLRSDAGLQLNMRRYPPDLPEH